MNCEWVRATLTKTLAAENLEFAPEVLPHLKTCVACHAFHARESKLRAEIDATLRSIVNQPVPPSLLPRVRKLLNETTTAPGWTHALLPLTAIVVLAGIVTLTFLRQQTTLIDGTNSVLPRNTTANAVKEQPQTDFSRKSNGGRNSLKHSSKKFMAEQHPNPEKSTALPDVLVDESESRAMAVLTSSVFREPAVGVAILHPVDMPTPATLAITSKEIAPLEVASLEIRPLRERAR